MQLAVQQPGIALVLVGGRTPQPLARMLAARAANCTVALAELGAA